MENSPDTLQDIRTDAAKRDQYISDHKKFIMGCAYKTVRHFVTESDDEWSIALIAFNEAIDSYDEKRGSFEGFASLVIKRRLVDYIRSESRFSGEMSMEPKILDGDLDEEEEPSPLQLEVRRKTGELSVDDIGKMTIKDEIDAMQDVLDKYGFSFFDLTECSPKAEKTRKSCALVVSVLVKEGDIFKKMRTNRTLPINELCKISKVPRKILERHRKYIIATAEIIHGDYPLLADYLGYIREAMS